MDVWSGGAFLLLYPIKPIARTIPTIGVWSHGADRQQFILRPFRPVKSLCTVTLEKAACPLTRLRPGAPHGIFRFERESRSSPLKYYVILYENTQENGFMLLSRGPQKRNPVNQVVVSFPLLTSSPVLHWFVSGIPRNPRSRSDGSWLRRKVTENRALTNRCSTSETVFDKRMGTQANTLRSLAELCAGRFATDGRAYCPVFQRSEDKVVTLSVLCAKHRILHIYRPKQIPRLPLLIRKKMCLLIFRWCATLRRGLRIPDRLTACVRAQVKAKLSVADGIEETKESDHSASAKKTSGGHKAYQASWATQARHTRGASPVASAALLLYIKKTLTQMQLAPGAGHFVGTATRRHYDCAVCGVNQVRAARVLPE